jgi:paraquat-inducible protein B
MLTVLIVVLGSAHLFQRSVKFICVFQGDLNGLRIGAPVKIRGVQIGSVSSIGLVLPPFDGRIRSDVRGFRLPVVVELDRSQVIGRGGGERILSEPGYVDWLKQGLRAQLSVESPLTGLLYIDLDLRPGSTADLVLIPGSSLYQEIPTVPTTLEAFQEKATIALEQLKTVEFHTCGLRHRRCHLD